MPAEVIPLLSQRRAEAEILRHVHATLVDKYGAEVAQGVIAAAVEAAARQAGAAFAAGAAGGPGLEHFSGILDHWRQHGALQVRDVRLDRDSFCFTVSRCRYVELYRSLGLSPGLAQTLSCRRDGAFAAGYSPQLILQRSSTLAEDAPACEFCFSWVKQPQD